MHLSGVLSSVCLSYLFSTLMGRAAHTQRYSPGAARVAASVHFRLSITRMCILVYIYTVSSRLARFLSRTVRLGSPEMSNPRVRWFIGNVTGPCVCVCVCLFVCLFVCAAPTSRSERLHSAPACACTRNARRTAPASTHAIGSVLEGNL